MRAAAASLVIFGVLVTGCESGPTVSSAPSIVIASDLPASEVPDARAASQAVLLAIEQHPQVGRYRLVYEPLDDSPYITSPVKGLQNMRRLVGEGQVLGMVGPFNSNAFGQVPIANPAGLAMVSPANTNWCLTLPSSDCNVDPRDLRVAPNNYFRVVAPDPIQGRAMARYARNTLKIQRAAVFTLGDPFDDLTAKLFSDEFRHDGGEVVLTRTLTGDPNAFLTFLKDARARNADAVYAATEHEAAESNVCPVRALMKRIFPDNAYFLGMDAISGLESSTCIREAGDNANGMVATVSVADPQDSAVATMVAAYRKRYSREATISPYAVNAYDCALILIQAITQAVNVKGGGFPTRPDVVSQIATSTFSGVAGSYSFDGNGDARSPLMAVYEVVDGKWVYEGQIDASA
jgi:branched-chain amino acid transport system substrate-binding protein